jgi:hypothetical protein
LADAGIVESVPLLTAQGHAIVPRDEPNPVLKAYRALLCGGKIKAGRYILMEIEHLAELGAPPMPDDRGAWRPSRDWRAMERHFGTISHECPLLEAVGATEAIHFWLDYYTPEPIVKLAPGSPLPEAPAGQRRGLRFPISFLGTDILTEKEKTFDLEVPLPRASGEIFSTVRIVRGSTVVFESAQAGRQPLRVRFFLSLPNRNDFTLEMEAGPPSQTEAEGSFAAVGDRARLFGIAGPGADPRGDQSRPAFAPDAA